MANFYIKEFDVGPYEKMRNDNVIEFKKTFDKVFPPAEKKPLNHKRKVSEAVNQVPDHNISFASLLYFELFLGTKSQEKVFSKEERYLLQRRSNCFEEKVR